MQDDENLVLNAVAASEGGVSALAIAWAACAPPLQIAEAARSLSAQGLLRRSERSIDVYETLGTTSLAPGVCFACATARVKAPAVLCSDCTKRRARAPMGEVEVMAAFVAAPSRSLNLADLAARSRSKASEVEALMLAWTQARVVALDPDAIEPAWMSAGVDRFAAAGEVARVPRQRMKVPRRVVVAALIVLVLGSGAFSYSRLQQARKAASSRYWDLKSALGEHEELLVPLVKGLDPALLKRSIGLSVTLDLDKHLARAKTMNDLVSAQGSKVEPFTQARIDAFNATFSASVAEYNARAERYRALRQSALGRLLCMVSRCTVFDPLASPF